MAERVLITGATGFLGRFVTQRFIADGAQVTVVARRESPELRDLPVRIVQADLREYEKLREACQDQDVIQHVGGISGIWGKWRDFYDVNTLSTRALLEGARSYGVQKFVYTSSPSVTFDGRDQCGVDESAPYARRWLCHYPHSKMLAEKAVLEAHGRDGLMTCALRPHLIWGPGDRHLIPRLLARARAGQLRRIGNGKNLIDIVHVENAAQAQWLATQSLQPGSPAGGKAYFISQGQPVNCWDWINQILQLADLPPVRRTISRQLASSIGVVLECIQPLLTSGEPRMTRFLASQLSCSHYFNISAAKRELGYTALVSTDEGMRRLAKELKRG
ncbi:MAG: NAD-dependent epimerase/dehydratase family protein [Planctomycetota bacterium]|nr:NAD-dependent epimerase/dehydratase family protein [Planctomycetota bacterium]MDA1179531.1 NAD-dependent epimerase/dehydratase family protein [Planctomycetota bacterium]